MNDVRTWNPEVSSDPLLSRRGFVKCGLAGMGLLAAASTAPATFFRRSTFLPAQDPGPNLASTLPPQGPLAFEYGSGVNPHHVIRALQDYFTLTLSPEYAAQLVQVQAIPRNVANFHEQFRSDYVLPNQFPPTRTRYGFYVNLDEVVRADSQVNIRVFQDLNFFEIRRLIHPGELYNFGQVLSPAGLRQPPNPLDRDAFYRVCTRLYGIPNPEMLTVLYTRLFTNGQHTFMGFLASRGPDPLRSPYKDLLLDNVPF
jgi:hypothetical protein